VLPVAERRERGFEWREPRQELAEELHVLRRIDGVARDDEDVCFRFLEQRDDVLFAAADASEM
jgi:hypothetical protein